MVSHDRLAHVFIPLFESAILLLAQLYTTIVLKLQYIAMHSNTQTSAHIAINPSIWNQMLHVEF